VSRLIYDSVQRGGNILRTKIKLSGLLITAVCLFLGLLLTACGSDNQTTLSSVEESVAPIAHEENEPGTVAEVERAESEQEIHHVLADQATEYIFPESIELQFKPVELTALASSKVGEGWVHTKTVPFGSIEGDPVVLNVYKVPEDDFCGFDYERVVLLTHKNEHYRYPDCFSSSLEGENPEQNQALFRLDHKQREQGAQSIVHGAVELSANGPGRMAYYYYDAIHGNWFGFEDWGYPRVADLDGDEVEELINQFPGLHMNWPDVIIYRWGDHGLSYSDSIKGALGVPNFSSSSATLDEQTNQIEVTAVMNLEPATYEAANYLFEGSKLLRQSK
jgi:hypothetical protein